MLIVVSDWVTKFTLVRPVTRATSKAVVSFLENDVFLLFGVPQICMVDNGPQFVSSEFKNLMQRYQVHKVWYNASYHPQVNYVERVNRVIGTAIRSYVGDNHRTWDTEIHKVAHAMRNSVHEVTGYTPSFLNLGRTVPATGDYYGCLTDFHEEDLLLDNRERIVHDINKLSGIYDDVRRRLKTAYERNSRHYNLRKRPLKFSIGDVVWKRNYVLSNASKHFVSKLAPKYIRCKVKEVTGSLTYRLINERGKNIGIWHIKDLKPNPPSTPIVEEAASR